jgi:hypothetical protein
MRVQTIATLLALVLVASLLTGCETQGADGLRFEDQCQGAACDGGVRVDAAVLQGDAATSPDGAQPDRTWPDSSMGDVSLADRTDPDAARIDSGRPDASTTDSLTTDLRTTDLPTTDLRTTDSRTTDSRTTDSRTTDLRTTDSRTTDVGTTDVGTTDLRTTDLRTTDSQTTDTRTVDAASALPDVVGEDQFDPCEGVFCGDRGHCELGACVCDNGSMAHPDNGCPPYILGSFALTDQNANSATFGQERVLADELGKVIVIFYALYT